MNYQIKPLSVEAFQWKGGSQHKAVEFCYFSPTGKLVWSPGDSPAQNIANCSKCPAVRTATGIQRVHEGDWVIDHGPYFHTVMTDADFKLYYEPVPSLNP